MWTSVVLLWGAHRGMGGRSTFVVESVEDCLARFGNSYQGPVALVMLQQFPMPYRFGGNDPNKDDDGTSNGAVAPSVAQGGGLQCATTGGFCNQLTYMDITTQRARR